MKRISALLISAFIISQGLVSSAQEDPCQSQVDALNTCRAGQTTTPSEATQPNEDTEATDNTAQSNE